MLLVCIKRKCGFEINVKDSCIFIGIATLILNIISLSMEKEWYRSLDRYNLMDREDDTEIFKDINKIVQSMQLTSSICLLFAVTYNGTSIVLKKVAIMIYLMGQFVSIFCFLILTITAWHLSSHTYYTQWKRINFGIVGGVYALCMLVVLYFMLVASEFLSALKDKKSQSMFSVLKDVT